MQSLAKDLYGPHGGPCDNSGFAITETGQNDSDFNIGAGHYYVDGILCEVDLLPAPNSITYLKQPDYPVSKDEELPNGNNLVYLDVWERHVTYIEEDSIREVALGGPDTATRAQVVCQVKVENKLPDDIFRISAKNVTDNWEKWVALWQPNERGMLKAQAKKDSKEDTDPCITSPESRYRGAENQLYRVEIHAGGRVNGNNDKPTFKWSRENSSVAAAWIDTDGDKLIVIGIRDVSHGFAAEQWVELTQDEREVRGELGIMVKLVKVEGQVLTVDPTTATQPIPSDLSLLKHPKVRRWDHSCEQKALGAGQAKVAKPDKGALLIEENQWLTLEDGVQIYFEKSMPVDHQYRTGDYWLIPARFATGDVEWPGPAGDPAALPPHGIEHHYAPLAIISVDVNGKVTLAAGADADLRSKKRLDDCAPQEVDTEGLSEFPLRRQRCRAGRLSRTPASRHYDSHACGGGPARGGGTSPGSARSRFRAPTRISAMMKSPLVGAVLFQIGAIGEAQALAQPDPRAPPERLQTAHVQELSRGAVGLVWIPPDLGPASDHTPHQLRQLADREVLPAADVEQGRNSGAGTEERIRRHLLDDAQEAGGIGEIPVVEDEARGGLVGGPGTGDRCDGCGTATPGA